MFLEIFHIIGIFILFGVSEGFFFIIFYLHTCLLLFVQITFGKKNLGVIYNYANHVEKILTGLAIVLWS